MKKYQPTDDFYKSLAKLTSNTYAVPFDSIFDEMLNLTFPDVSKTCGQIFSKQSFPKVNIIDYPDKLKIELETMSYDKSNITIQVNNEDNTLTVSGVKEKDNSDKLTDGGTYLKREIKHSTFSRSFILHEELDSNTISANFESGMLYITILKIKKEEKQKSIIDIKID